MSEQWATDLQFKPPVRKQVAVSRATLPHLLSSLPVLSSLYIPRCVGFFITGLEQSRIQPGGAYSHHWLSPVPSAACGLTWGCASHVSRLIPVTSRSVSQGEGRCRTGAICLHVMEVWGLWSEVRPHTAHWRGTAATDAKTLPSVCACVTLCQDWINGMQYATPTTKKVRPELEGLLFSYLYMQITFNLFE